MGESLPAERVTLYLRSADATSYVEVASTENASASNALAADAVALTGEEGFSLADYPVLATQLAKSEAVCWRAIEELPADAEAERSLFGRDDVASLLYVPMVTHGALVGLLEVAAIGVPRAWSEEAPVLTGVVIDMISSALARKRSEEAAASTEERLRTTERLEIVGRLAGGIAHDFNNYLTAILGYGELLADELEGAEHGLAEIGEIRNAAERASTLVEQILGFSRKKSHDPRTLDLNSVVALLAKIVDRVAGDGIEVVYQLDEEIGSVRVDPSRFDQLILNLVSNARDAMTPNGGLLTVATNAVRIEGDEAVMVHADRDGVWAGLQPPTGLAFGEYVVLSVLDTGCGMSDHTRTRLFEPFYSTKRGGRGTGIGLSTVAGIVEACGGAISVESELGVGSAFHVFLPTAQENALAVASEGAAESIAKGHGETVLLIEPESVVRGLLQRLLERWGYRVLGVEDGPSALRVCASHSGPIHLLVTDLGMPRLCGLEIAEQVSRARPSTRVLFTSSHCEQVLVDEGVWKRSAPVVEKPFALHSFAAKVREALDRD